MTPQEFNEFVQQFQADQAALLCVKGKDYGRTDDDRLANFKTSGAALGMTAFQIWGVYFCKHVDSVLKAIRENPNAPISHSEPLVGRLHDISNYALLMGALLKDAEQ